MQINRIVFRAKSDDGEKYAKHFFYLFVDSVGKAKSEEIVFKASQESYYFP